MTMASAEAIWGEYSPNGGIQWHLGSPSLPYWAMRLASYHLTCMAFRMAREAGACFSFIDFMSFKSIAK
jgi:hypothetical protein